MRSALLYGGAAAVAIGILLLSAGYVVVSQSQTEAVPAGAALSITPTGVGGGMLTASWNGADPNSTVYLITGTATCSSPSGLVAKGSGTDGSFTASVTSGTQYQFYACANGRGTSMTASYSVSEITILMVLGIVLAIVGAVLIVLGYRGGSSSAAAMPPRRPSAPSAAARPPAARPRSP